MALLGVAACSGKNSRHSATPGHDYESEAGSVPQPSPDSPIAMDGDSADSAGENYQAVPENKVKTARQESVSTFSIDVDTASYANTRRHLKSNRLPPVNSVRLEEFINYFRYDYDGPDTNEPFAVHTEIATAPWAEQERLVKIGLQGLRMDTSELPKRNLVFLIDVSGSMSSHNKLPLLKQGFKMLVRTLREEDRVSIVVYAGAAGAVLLPTSGAEQNTILASLDRLQSGGSTNGAQGIELAYDLAEQNFQSDAINRIILASDGDFNVGMTNKQALIKLIEKKRTGGVYFSALGFGSGNLNDATMEQLADKGNGNYSYIDSAREAQKVLVDEGGSNLVTIAKDVKIQVEWNAEAVESYRLIGYDNRVMDNEDFENDHADAGELGPGHSVTALYQIVPKPSSAAKKLASVRLRYKLPGELASKLIVHEVDNQSTSFAEASQDMRFATALAGFGLLLKKSPHSGSLNWARLQQMAVAAVGATSSEHRQEFLQLLGTARRLDEGNAAPSVIAR